jgi:2Fe-2S ferredoxin
MATIRILPIDVEIQAGEGATVMGAAQDAGYYWPTTCGGEGRCTTCACEIIEGAGGLTPMGRSEEKTLVLERGESVLRSNLRLACQARLCSDAAILVRKAGVRRPLDAG